MISGDIQKTTPHKIVLPFYLYATLSFLAACIMVFISNESFQFHHFNPKILAITHVMALGWGTMMILGASYQLIPVLIEGKLYNNFMAYLSFAFAAIGIPVLIYGFYTFNMGWPLHSGGTMINIAVLLYIVNLSKSLMDSKSHNVHAIISITAAIWLFSTTLIGLLLALNFDVKIFSQDSLRYLSIHAHIGIIGWFLQLVIGVGSRLIPMFLISKYTNQKLLWKIFAFINIGLILFIVFDLYIENKYAKILPAILILISIIGFIIYCKESYHQRIRKNVDEAMKLSLISVLMQVLPILILIVYFFTVNLMTANSHIINLYGFLIFFGWLTAIILGMTFKTLPFIVWNKVYHNIASNKSTPNPKDLFNETVFRIGMFSYLFGIILFSIGIGLTQRLLLETGAILLLAAAILYNINVFKIVMHKPVR